MPENRELRAIAREQLKGHWVNPIVVTLIFLALMVPVSAIPMVGWVLSLVIGGPLALGLATFYLNFKRNNNPKVEEVFVGFNNFGSAFTLHVVKCVFIFLWGLLLVVPGIIAAYRYSMAMYILSDNPNIGAMGALDRSKEMMMGNKMQLFMLGLSFLGWVICCILTLGIGFLWLVPYINLTMANFYENLKGSQGIKVDGSDVAL